jgi:predicted dehydrogenase
MPNKTYRIALIGAGAIARVHAAAIAEIPHAELVAVYDKYEAACRAFTDATNGAGVGAAVEWTTDLDTLLARSDVDVVHVCTPSGTHAEPAIRAAQAGKHLAVEKPLDVTVARSKQIIAAARENGRKLAGIFPYRFRQGILAAHAAIAQGRLGRITLADAYVKWYRPQDYYRGWHGTWALDGGGALINQSIHTIDLLQWLAGPVQTVYGQIATLGHQMEAEDTAGPVTRLAVRYTAHGARSCLKKGGSRPGSWSTAGPTRRMH